MIALRILKPGSQTTIQDAGRPGLRRYGIPSSGAMDQFACQVANLLVGNAPGAAALESLLQGLSLEVLVPTVIAVTGGDLGAELNECPLPLWTSLSLQPDDRLTFKRRAAGCRAYIAIRGGLAVPEFLGSKSTFTKGGMGTPLQANDTLPIGDSTPPPQSFRRQLPAAMQRPLSSESIVRVILGPQTDAFTVKGRETFLSSEYRISPKSDRQGFRTEGPAVETVRGSDIITDPTPLGAIQVPGDGQPIILLRDGQVTGGYAKIATVISADMDQFGQMSPGDKIRFQEVSRDEALLAASESRRLLSYLSVSLLGS